MRIADITGRPSFLGVLAPACLALVIGLAAGCDTEEHGHEHDWCSTEADKDKQQCTVKGQIEWCHVLANDDIHPHFGMDCKAYGYECHVVDWRAACVQPGSACPASGVNECKDGVAHRCFEGKLAFDVCTPGECHVENGQAVCEEAEAGEELPKLACDAMAAAEVEDVTPATTFAGFPDAHADLGKAVKLSLPEQQESYFHFPGASTGEYVVFLGTAGVFDSAWDKDENRLEATKAGANGECPEVLEEHWHVHVVNDSGEARPQIVKLKAVPAGELELVVMRHGEEKHEHENEHENEHEHEHESEHGHEGE